MFCPKCGTSNPDTGKFCRSCGIDLGNVSAVMGGDLPAHFVNPAVAEIHNQHKRRSDPHEVYAAAIRNIISGFGFLVVSMALLFTGVAGGRAWWWAMLFPASTFLAKGFADFAKYRKMEQKAAATPQAYAQELNQSYASPGLPPTRTEYVSPESTRYKTGDLVPPSVTDTTTRHLEMNTEGEAMTLPKKP